MSVIRDMFVDALVKHGFVVSEEQRYDSVSLDRLHDLADVWAAASCSAGVEAEVTFCTRGPEPTFRFADKDSLLRFLRERYPNVPDTRRVL